MVLPSLALLPFMMANTALLRCKFALLLKEYLHVGSTEVGNMSQNRLPGRSTPKTSSNAFPVPNHECSCLDFSLLCWPLAILTRGWYVISGPLIVDLRAGVFFANCHLRP